MKSINYDEIANAYDERYKRAYGSEGIASKLLNLAQESNAERILEVACGTGHWLEILQVKAQVYGMDLSFGMPQKAIKREAEAVGETPIFQVDISLSMITGQV